MSKNFLAMVTYMGETVVFTVGTENGYRFILEKVSSTWTLEEGCFSVYYAVRSKRRCFLGSEDDFKSLTMLVSMFGMDYVDFEVVHSDVGAERSMCHGSIASSSSSVSVNVHHSYDIVPNFCKHQTKDLLSSGWEKLLNGVGQRFEGGAKEFRICLRKYCLAIGHEFRYMKNSLGRVKAVCALKEATSCSWMVSASKKHGDGSFQIRKLVNIHNCHDGQPSFRNRNMTSELVASLIEDNVRAKGSVRPMDVVREVSSQYGVSICYGSAWKSVEKAKKAVYGSELETFEYLKWYVQSTLEANPSSHINLEVEETSGRFRRLFIAYDACIKGFNHCRPMLFLDGTHLKGVYKGHILSAVGKDGNQGLYPLCFAIVDSENRSNWEWFLENLKIVLDPSRVMTFISDRNLGLLESLEKVFPSSFNAYCLFHMKMNLRDRLSRTRFGKATKDRLIYLLTQCAYAPTLDCFKQKMEEFLELGGSVVTDFLSSMPLDRWANAHFKGMRFGEIWSNAVESFNKWVVLEREMPVGSLVDAVRVKLMKQISDRRRISEQWTGDICFDINRRLSLQFKEGSRWPIICSSPGVFEVQSKPSVMVDLSKRYCDCYGWQLNGLPCSHAVVCIIQSGLKLECFVDSWFQSATYRLCYATSIQPIPTLYKPISLPEEMKVLPPSSKRPPGRPKMKRIRSRGEDVAFVKCSRCGRLGHHNRRSCKAPIMM